MELYISPQGNDQWSGGKAEATAKGDDGPLASVEGALNRVRGRLRPPVKSPDPLRQTTAVSGPVIVWMRGGRYPVERPITITEQDEIPVTFRAYRDEIPIIDGAQKLSGWSETRVNGKRAFCVTLPEVASGEWYFRSLFVNGRRAMRPRLPKQGFYEIDEVILQPGQERKGWGSPGNDCFRVGAGHIDSQWKHLTDIDAVVLHYWIDERMPIATYDAETRLLTSTRESRAPLFAAWNQGPASYYLDNVFEGLTDPGEWYLDRETGQCWYLPQEGETLDTLEAYAPRVLQLLRIEGDVSRRCQVSWVGFEGITFEHTDWAMHGDKEVPVDVFASIDPRLQNQERYASGPQGAVLYPGAIQLRGARHCTLENCVVRHVGWYGIDVAEGCQHIRLIGNSLSDLGAGGIKLDGASMEQSEDRKGAPYSQSLCTGYLRVTDNHIHHGGQVFHAGVGILGKHVFGSLFLHNHIHDLYYSGISVGWTWGYRQTVARENVIAFNHLHDLGKGWLSDMGGVYLLGPQSGTHVHHNLIHDIQCRKYGGWAIYPDEGSAHLTIEDNICYRTSSAVFHQHYGRENVVRNNIFAFGGEGIVALGRTEQHGAFTLLRNVLLSDGQPFYAGGYAYDVGNQHPIDSDLNLLWDINASDGVGVAARNKQRGTAGALADEELSWQEWQQAGHDLHSLIADPQCTDLSKDNFMPTLGSPAFALGFKPIDLSSVGPRPEGKRE